VLRGPSSWARTPTFSAKIRDLWVAEIWFRKAVDGGTGRGLYPAPHRKRGGHAQGSILGPGRLPPIGESLGWMFDIVNGRETRAAVLLAGFARTHTTYDGLRFSMESQFYGRPVMPDKQERASRQIYANALQRPRVFPRGFVGVIST